MLRTEGIVLSEMRYKDTSKILKIYTRKYGKISAMARGAYKPRSILTASTQPFSYNEYLLHKGRSFYYLNQGSVIDPFYQIRENMERFLYASYLLELIDKSTPEEEASEKIFLLLAKGLDYLSTLEKDFLKFSLAFGLKYISFLGYRPNLASCVNCGGSLTPRLKFSHLEGGSLCQDCFSRDINASNIDISILEAIGQLLYSPLEDLEKISLEENLLIRIEKILDDYILYNIDRKEFNSLKMLKTLI